MVNICFRVIVVFLYMELVLLFVALWFILRGDLFYVLSCVILFLCFSVLLALRLPRLFDLCLFSFVGFLFLLVPGKGCGLWLWQSLDFSLTFFHQARNSLYVNLDSSDMHTDLGISHITKTHLFKYIENFTTKKEKFWDKISDIWYSFFHFSAQNIDCGYSLESPRRGGSNEYPQSMRIAK